MAETTGIAWCDATWNPWVGCKKISEGCDNCYMFREYEGLHKNNGEIVRKTSPRSFLAPERWLQQSVRADLFREAGKVDKVEKMGKVLESGAKIFVCSWSDFFIPQADAWRGEVWKMMKRLPYTFLILTKRIERADRYLPDDWENGYPNVWLGVSVENNDHVDRINALLKIPAAVHWVSAEPLLGPVELSPFMIPYYANKLNWVVVGGESGNNTGLYRYRNCELKWIENVVEDCTVAGVPVFVKQLGSNLSNVLKLNSPHGKDVAEFPVHLQRQEFPE